MRKYLSAFFLALIMITMMCSITAYAVDAKYSYTTSATSTLTITSGTAYCKSTAKGNSTVTEIDAVQYLEKKSGSNWVAVSGGTWSGSANTRVLNMSNSKSNLSGGTYRLRTVFTVYNGSNSETVEKISSEVMA